jgi:7-carboxy-7-deazaguanine synthase
MLQFEIAERFKSVQGEGKFSGTPMAFIRFVGCSVGKKTCQHCDTDFEKPLWHLEGGTFGEDELLAWIGSDYEHVCLTGGEPLDQPFLTEFIDFLSGAGKKIHIETSGTVYFSERMTPRLRESVYLTVSPKPGFKRLMIDEANELKVIIPGLGNGEGWPTFQHVDFWAAEGKLVYIQPRNAKMDINMFNLQVCEAYVRSHPKVRLSLQLHKILKVR